MTTEKLSVRQLAACAFTGGLAVAVSCAGYGWQGPLLAAPVILLAGWALSALIPRWALIEGKRSGKALGVLYALWGAALLGRGLSRCALRVMSAAGAPEKYTPWLIALLALPLLWMARGKPAAFFRAAEIFYLAVAVTGAALLVWGACKLDWARAALPAPDLWGGFLGALETGGTFLFILPYINRTLPLKNGAARTLGWLAALCAGTVAICLVTAGVLSPAVASRVPQPFFLMTAVLGRAVRVEGLAGALWLLADLAYLGLLSRSWQRTGTGSSALAPVAVLAGAVCAALGLPALLPAAAWGWGTAALALLTAAALLTAGKNR